MADRKKITDWDAYFIHRQQVQYAVWHRWYSRNVDAARDKDAARQLYSMLIHGLGMITTPDRQLGQNVTSNGELIDPAYEVTADYYEKLYEGFKLSWQLYENKPVALFLQQTAPGIVRHYWHQLADLVDKFDWERKLKIQTDAPEYVKSSLGRKHIVNWLAFCAARNRIRQEVVAVENLGQEPAFKKSFEYAEPVIEPSDEPDKAPVIDKQPAQSVTPRERDRTTVPKIPVRETTRTDYELISAKVKGYMKSGINKSEAMKKVADEMSKTERVIYNALRAYPIRS